MSRSIIQMVLVLWQVWCHDHFLGKLFQVTSDLLNEKHFPKGQTELPLMKVPSIFLPSHSLSSHWSPERGDQHLPFCCPPWGSFSLSPATLINSLSAHFMLYSASIALDATFTSKKFGVLIKYIWSELGKTQQLFIRSTLVCCWTRNIQNKGAWLTEDLWISKILGSYLAHVREI